VAISAVRRSFLDRCWGTLLVALLALIPAAAGARGESRHVLVLSSSERPFAPQSGFADALMRDLIGSSRVPIQFVEVSVQAARASGEPPDASTVQRIRSAFGGDRLDLVLTIGGPAATFAQQFRQDLFPGTLMLLAGVDRRFVEQGTFDENQTTVAIEHEPALMIDEILRLLPDTRTVMVVVGCSQVEQFWLKEMQREFGRFSDRLQFIWTNELSYSEILTRSRMMPAHSAIFFAILALDGKGEPRIENDTLTDLHRVANAPMFSLYGMGRGIVGGPLLSTEDLSRATTDVALRVLAGESPGGIKTPIQSKGRLTYDARELQRWRIDERRLSQPSVVLFREPTVWERYQRAIGLVALVGGIPAFALLVRRRRGQRQHGEKRALADGTADALVKIWTAGVDGQRVSSGDAAGAAERESWTATVHPDDVERCREIYRHALERREPFQMEYRVHEAGGMERWILDTGLPKFSGEDFDGYVGSAVDVTGIGRARAELSNLSRHLMQAQERDRAALAMTLREDVCQRMVVLTLRLHELEGAADDGEVAGINEELRGLVGQIAAASDPAQQRLELLGLAAAGRSFCEELATRSHVAIHFQDEHVPLDLPSDIALALFRVLQEAAVNAVDHSGVREVWVSISGTAAHIYLQVVDHGVGFDTQRATPGGGVGLVAMRERVKLVNGDSTITSRPGEGTRVEAWVPLR
jgi:signal transduction histidine kinase